MLEPWASRTMEERLATRCYTRHRWHGCSNCDQCPLNITFLHQPQTERRELVYRMAEILGDNKSAVGKIVLCSLPLIGILLWWFWPFLFY